MITRVAVAILVALGIATGCGGLPPYQCSATTGEDSGCVFGPACPKRTLFQDTGTVDDGGTPIFSCTDPAGRTVTDCVLTNPDGTAAGLCRAEAAP